MKPKNKEFNKRGRSDKDFRQPNKRTKFRRTTNRPIQIPKSSNSDMDIDNESSESVNEDIWFDFNKLVRADNIDKTNEDMNKEWVSATGIKNYLINDPILDWLHLNKNNYKKLKSNSNIPKELEELEIKKFRQEINEEYEKVSTIFEKGNRFEEDVLSLLREAFPGSSKTVLKDPKLIKPELMGTTFQLMKEGIPIIEGVPLYNHKNRTFGTADIIVRSDWVNRIFKKPVLLKEEENISAPLLDGHYHYVVIDIKWTTIELCSNGYLIRNDKLFPAYKGQIAIYNAALGQLQGYTPAKGYVLAKGWKYSERNRHYQGYNCLDLLGEIDYAGWDNRFIEESIDAIRWVRQVRYHGHNWSLYPTPTVPELYPNMCNRYDSPYHKVKKEIAGQLEDMTQVWNVGVKHRNIALDKGIDRWSDSRCTSNAIGLTGKRVPHIVDNIFEINRSQHYKIRPGIISNNVFNWQKKSSSDFYVDFESINGDFYQEKTNLKNSKVDNGVIFMIGVGYEEDGEWRYECFSMNSFTLFEERRIIKEFVEFISKRRRSRKAKPNLFHWGSAETTLFRNANKRHNYAWTRWEKSINWLDFCRVFQDEPIVVKNAMKFGIKEIAKAMRGHGFISCGWDDCGPKEGLEAMREAANYYKFMEAYGKDPRKFNPREYLNQKDIYMKIINYNEDDCKAVWEIVNYLRDKHCKIRYEEL